MRDWGQVFVAVAFVLVSYGIFMDVSVSTLSGDRVLNIGLLNNKTNVFIISGFCLVSGVLFIGFSKYSGDFNRSCPYCAENIKAKARVCRFCQKDLPEVACSDLDEKLQSGWLRAFLIVFLICVLLFALNKMFEDRARLIDARNHARQLIQEREEREVELNRKITSSKEPIRAKLESAILIDAPINEVWKLIKNFSDLSWFSGVSEIKSNGGNEIGAVRKLNLKEGGTVTEVLKQYSANKMSYRYVISEMSSNGNVKSDGKFEEIPAIPVSNYVAELSLQEISGKTKVKWIATYFRGSVNPNPPHELNDSAADKAVENFLTIGLKDLAKKFNAQDKSNVEIILTR